MIWVGGLAGGVAFVTCLALVPLARRIGLRIGACDQPGETKIHREGISLLGGAAMCVGWLAALGTSAARGAGGIPLLVLGLGGLIALALGTVDDLLWKNDPTRYRPNVKFAVQVATAALLAAALFCGGIRPAYVALAAAQFPLLLVYVFGGMNATNMTDGMDGLAGAMVALSAAGFAVIAALSSDGMLLSCSAALVGITIGFLAYNRPPASIFMGDGGSHFLGFAVAALAVLATRQSAGVRAFVGPILILGVPVADAGLAVVRRIVQRDPLFHSDRGHVYDLLLGAGLSQWTVLLLLGVVQAGLVSAGVLLMR